VRAVEVDNRLGTVHGRLDLAREIIGIMFHPNSPEDRRHRQSAMAETLLGMRDKDDEPEAVKQAKTWFRQAGGFKTSSKAFPYDKQQDDALEQVSAIVAVGSLLNSIWMMDAHHRDQLSGGASLHKAVAIYSKIPLFAPVADRALRKYWARYKPVAHFCAAFATTFLDAITNHQADTDEFMKWAYVEDLHHTLGLVAAYQRFGMSFAPHGIKESLIDPTTAWCLRGVEPESNFVPPPLPAHMLAEAKRYNATPNRAYR
jgi:hypothetical protein